MSQRYYCESPLEGDELLGSDVVLHGAEAHHLASVMRAQAGDRVALFDGRGNECEASVAEMGRREVRLHVEARRDVDREAAVELTLAVALPKGDRQRWLVEKATELGVARLVPIVAQRSVVQLKSSGIERLERFVIEACKQCGRNRLMMIDAPIVWGDFLAKSPIDALRLIAHPNGTGCAEAQIRPPLMPVIAAVGPEGGFTNEEFQAADAAGWQAVSLGPRILRVETAAVALAALLLLR